MALAISLTINFVLFVVAYFKQTDKLTDLSYTLSFVAVMVLLLPQVRDVITVKKAVLTLMILLWAFRLGGYLVIRINKFGRDKRFDQMRKSFWLFGRFWLLQAITVVIILTPSILLINSAPVDSLSLLDCLGIGVFLTGLAVETIADMQKYNFITSKSKGWIDSGLWSYSRHPNYLGEILVWVGVYIFTYASLTSNARLLGLISPMYIYTILRYVSGVPLLEKKADQKWGNDKAYQKYKNKTGLIAPKLF